MQDNENQMRIRRPSPPAQQRATSFVGLQEPSLQLDDAPFKENKPALSLELEYERVKRRMDKLEMLLEVYDIPLPPWKERG